VSIGASIDEEKDELLEKVVAPTFVISVDAAENSSSNLLKDL
jgi:hypothetical protein